MYHQNNQPANNYPVKNYNLADQPDKSHVTRATEPDETHHSHVQFADPDRLTINYNAAKKNSHQTINYNDKYKKANHEFEKCHID
jgi:hypothetical protein